MKRNKIKWCFNSYIYKL